MIAGNAFLIAARSINVTVHCKNETVKTQLQTLLPSSANFVLTYVVD